MTQEWSCLWKSKQPARLSFPLCSFCLDWRQASRCLCGWTDPQEHGPSLGSGEDAVSPGVHDGPVWTVRGWNLTARVGWKNGRADGPRTGHRRGCPEKASETAGRHSQAPVAGAAVVSAGVEAGAVPAAAGADA